MAEETLFTDIINNLGKTKIKAQGSGSKSGKTGSISTGDRSAIQLPKGITSDSQKIDITANVTAPVTDKFSILGDIQYNKFRDKIEKGDQELFLQDAPSNIDRKVGIGYNEGGEGFSGYAKYGIDSEKPEYFVQYKKSFKDGGSTNGSADKAFTGKVKELMEDGYEFGEAVKEAMRQGYNDGGKAGYVEGGNVTSMEAMIQKLYTDFGQALVDSESLKKHGKSIRDITSDQRGNLKRRLEKFKSFIKENNRMPNEDEARKLGRKDKAVTDAVGKDGKGVTEESIRENMIKKGKVVKMVQGKVIFADPIKQQQFVEDLTKRYLIV
jgi:hypothetical protein